MPPMSMKAPKSISVFTVPMDDLTFLDGGQSRFASFFLFLLEDDAPIDDDIVLVDIEFGDLAANLLTDQLLHVGHIASAAA